MGAAGSLIVLRGGGSVGSWPPPKRQALPPKPGLTSSQPPDPLSQCWSQDIYDERIPFTPPSAPTRAFLRGNFTLLIPGFTGGFNDKDRSLLITWELPALSASDQDYCLRYIARVLGHTHIVLSRPQTLNMGKGLGDLLASALKAKSYGLFVLVVAVSDGTPFSDATPWFDTLRGAGAIDGSIFCWQADRYYDPDSLCDGLVAQSNYCNLHNLLRLIHWINGACAWWPSSKYGIYDRWQFQQWAVAYLDTHLMQSGQNAPLDQLQSGASKVLVSLPYGLTLCDAETVAQGLYDNPSALMALYGRQNGRYFMASHYGMSTQALLQPLIQAHLKGGIPTLQRTAMAAQLKLGDKYATYPVSSAEFLEDMVTRTLAAERQRRQTTNTVSGVPLDLPAGVMSGGYLNDASYDDGSML